MATNLGNHLALSVITYDRNFPIANVPQMVRSYVTRKVYESQPCSDPRGTPNANFHFRQIGDPTGPTGSTSPQRR
jgi:hypothetical protein